MSTPKPAKSDTKSSGPYAVKFSNKTGGAYADMKAVIQSESKNWDTSKTADGSVNSNGNKDQGQGRPSKK